jgi:hypothetical protein
MPSNDTEESRKRLLAGAHSEKRSYKMRTIRMGLPALLFCAGSFILALFAPPVCAQTQTLTYSYSGSPLPIYPSSWNTWSIISLSVPNNLTVTKVTVSLQVQYSGLGDLNIFCGPRGAHGPG